MGWRLIAHDAVDSTNAVARALITKGAAEEGTVVWAREQTGGRGRQGRVWHSPPGNLYHSYVLRPDVPLAEAARLSFGAALAVAEALEALCPIADPRCKWPNDIVCHGGKVAGMLMETVSAASGPPWLVLGIGVNLKTAPITGALFPALAMEDLGCPVGLEDLLSGIAQRLAYWLAKWRQDGFAPVRAAWLERALGVGKPVEVRLGPHRTQRGIFQGLDEAGCLVLAEEDGMVRLISAGDVFFPPQEGA